MKRLTLSLLIATSALGQLWSPAQLKDHIATNLPSGAGITARMLRETLTNVVTSTLFITNDLSDLNSPASARGNLGVAIGSDVQAYDSQLDDLSSGTLTGYIIGNGASPYTASATIPSTAISGTLSVSVGGTGAGTLTGHLSGNGTSPITASATIPAADLSGLGTGIPAAIAATPTGSGVLVLATNANLTTPTLTNASIGQSSHTQKAAVWNSSGVLSGGNASNSDLNSITGISALTGYLYGNGTSPVTASTSIPSTAISGTLSVSVGGTGAGTLTGHISGNGTSAFTASSTIPVTDLSGLGTGVDTLLSGASSGTGGPAGTASPTFTGVTTSPTFTGVSYKISDPAVPTRLLTLDAPSLPPGGRTQHFQDADGTVALIYDTINPTSIRVGLSAGVTINRIRHGRATLVAGVAVVSDSWVTTSTRIILSVYTSGGTRGFIDTGTRTASTSFTITSSSVLDTSVVDWVSFEP